jgi:uncharacterized surface protein with fasciclin (FAS1) repeats
LFSRTLTFVVSALALTAPLAALAQTTDAAPAASASAAAPMAGLAMPASPNLAPAGDMMATLKANPHFSILVKALAAANLDGVLASTPDITLFAPTDEAFAALPPATVAALMKTDNAPILQKILVYHLIHLDLDSSKIKGAKGPVTTVEGQPVQIDGSGAMPMVNDAMIIQMDVKPTNGYIQVINKVLLPSDVTVPTS